MNNRTVTTSLERPPSELAIQVRKVQEHFPELYDYLVQRDRTFEHALRRIPSQADIELACAFDIGAHLKKTLRERAPGVGALCESEAKCD